jgi:hypothetical protein
VLLQNNAIDAVPQVGARHYCRNGHCRALLLKEAENPRSRFCCEACESSFYKECCRVCERALPDRRTARRRLCGRAQCRHEFERNPERFVSAFFAPGVGSNGAKKPPRYPSAKLGSNGQKNLTKSTAKTGDSGDRPLRVVAGPMPSEANLRVALDPATAASFKRDRDRLREHFRKLGTQCLFQRDTPPVNIVGGYKFPGAPKIDLRPTAPKPPAVAPESRPDLIPDDLSIPQFLRRTRT